jgi:hypothetical protein
MEKVQNPSNSGLYVLILNVPGLNLGQVTGYPEKGFRRLSEIFEANVQKKGVYLPRGCNRLLPVPPCFSLMGILPPHFTLQEYNVCSWNDVVE